MFFIFSKILYFLIQPINWVIGLMLYSLFSKKKERKRKALVLAVILALFFSNRLILNQFLKWWETDTITADLIEEPYDIGILLGGYSTFQIRPNHDRHNFSPRTPRFLNTYELYKTGKVKKLLLTGGSGAILNKEEREASMVKDFLIRIGVPEEDIIVEPEARNTYENAVYTKKLLDEKYPDARCLLITSAMHMPRSIGCFEKVGVDFTPYSVDFISEIDRWSPENTIIPDRMGFYYWEMLVKEWVGYVAYLVKGYI